MSIQKYRVHEVTLQDGDRSPIVLQCKGGSSALVALSNFLFLTNPDFRELETEGGIKGRPKYVKTKVLLKSIESRVRELFVALEEEEMVTDICRSTFKTTIGLLPQGIHFDPVSTSCTEFVESHESALFDLLSAFLCHGWLIDPEEDASTAEAIGSHSYDDIVKMTELSLGASESIPQDDHNTAVIIKEFLDESKNQLTPFGLRCLNQEVPEDAFRVLYRNEHFSLLFKHKGRLLTLHVDEDQLKTYPDAVWKKFGEANDDWGLLTWDLKPIEQKVVIRHIHEPLDSAILKDLIGDDISDKPKSKPSKKKRRKMQKKTTNVNEGQPGLNEEEAQGVGEPKVKTEEPRDAKHEIGTAEQTNAEPDVETEEQRDAAMSQNFLRFLSEFKEEGSRAPYFEGQVKALHHCGNFAMNVSFDDLENYNKQNARYICHNSPRVFERLRLCLCEFLLKHEEFKMMSGEVAEKTRLQIIGLPAPNSVLPFKKFTTTYPMHKIWELLDLGGVKVCAPTYFGRVAGHGYVNFMLKNHKAGHCWNGSFSEEDMEVLIHTDGSMEFIITKTASYGLSQEKGNADFTKFCEIVFPYFQIPEVEGLPPYFDHFQKDYMRMPEPEDREAYDKWCKYMSCHFAFKSPQARSFFVTQAFEVFDAERGVDPKYMPLDLVGDLDDTWNTWIENSASVSLNESYINSDANIYEELTYWRLLTFGCHFLRHMLRPRKDGSIIIKVEDLIIIDLMLVYILKNEMAKLIWYIMVEKNFSCNKMLSSAWRHFEASETFDEDEKEVLNLGEDEKKLLNTTDVACSTTDATESKVVSPQGKNDTNMASAARSLGHPEDIGS